MTKYEYHMTEAEKQMLHELERKRAYMVLYEALNYSEDYYPMELTDDDIDNIIDEFLDNRNGEDAVERIERDMDDAIRRVKERKYELEVHYVVYETTTIVAMSEEEAHEVAKNLFERTRGNIIGVRAVGTVKVDGEEVNNEFGEHTTEWEV